MDFFNFNSYPPASTTDQQTESIIQLHQPVQEINSTQQTESHPTDNSNIINESQHKPANASQTANSSAAGSARVVVATTSSPSPASPVSPSHSDSTGAVAVSTCLLAPAAVSPQVLAVRAAMEQWSAQASAPAEVLEAFKPDCNDNTILVKDNIRYWLTPIPAYNAFMRKVFGFTINCRCKIYDEVRLTVWIVSIISAITVLAFFIADFDYHSISTEQLQLNERILAIVIGGVFGVLACLLSFVQIRQHYASWQHPPSQKCVVRILLMVPVYSLSAWTSLLVLQWSAYLDFVRTCYEAYVIYIFMILLTKYLGGHEGVVQFLQFKQRIPWPSPLGFLPPVKPDSSFLYWLKYGTLQYAIVAPILALFAVSLDKFQLYGEGEIRWDHGYVYVAFIQNLTQIVALYALVWLYVTMKNELGPFKPGYKFLVVKAVVFFTFWQSVLISVLVHMSVIKDTETLKVGEVQIGLQDLLVCIEMFIAACLHKYTFGVETYANGEMKLLMDQRALQIAQLTYERAVKEAQAKEEEAKKLRKRKRRMKRLAKQAMADTEGIDAKLIKIKKKRKKKNKHNQQSTSTLTNNENKQQHAIATDVESDTQHTTALKKDFLKAATQAIAQQAQAAAEAIQTQDITIPINSPNNNPHIAIDIQEPLLQRLASTNSNFSQHSETDVADNQPVLCDDEAVLAHPSQPSFQQLLVQTMRAEIRKQQHEQKKRRKQERIQQTATTTESPSTSTTTTQTNTETSKQQNP